MQEAIRQRLQTATTHDLARRIRRSQEVQMSRLRKGFQIQTPLESEFYTVKQEGKPSEAEAT